jgi:nitroreductase
MIRRLKKKIADIVYLSFDYLQLLSGVIYDFQRYCQFSITGWRRNTNLLASVEALIIKEYHVIEKGLAMPDFRYRFGIAHINGLIYLMHRYRAAGGSPNNPHYMSAILCLKDYSLRHEHNATDISDIITPAILSTLMGGLDAIPNNITGGVNKSSARHLFSKKNSAFGAFALSRKSCRDFDLAKSVDRKTIEAAVLIAQSAPSVCNRQAWRVHSYFKRGQIDQLLEHQNGNHGFGHRINCLLVVTVSLDCFTTAIERYQMWIDGGMFGMMLLLALHHLELGAVPLNWSVLPAQDRNLRETGQIPAVESVIMLIGVGHPSEHLFIPNSQRRNLQEIYFDHSHSKR